MKHYLLPLMLSGYLVIQTGWPALGQEKIADPVYPVTQLREDFTRFRAALEENHPSLYWHVSKDTMDQAFRTAASKINQPTGEMEFFRILAPVVTKIGCGHTFMPIPAEMARAAAQKDKFFPLEVVFLKGRAYITGDNRSGVSLPKGSEIIRINGQKMDRIVARLFEFTVMDNNTATYKYQHSQANFADFYHYFVESPDTFQIEYRYANQRHTATLPALTKQAIAANRQAKASRPQQTTVGLVKPTDRVLSLTILSTYAVAVLTIKNFADDRMRAKGQHFQTFVDSAFREISNKNIQNLIIDVRGNSGGSGGNASYLYAYLTDEPFQVDAYMEVKTLPLKYIDLTGINDSNGNTIVLKESDFTKTPSGTYHQKDYPSLRVVPPHKKGFKGKVYVLIDGWVSSEGSNLAYLLHHRKRGVFIGEETGGNYNGCSAGILAQARLSNTNLRITIPVFKIVHPLPNPAYESRGILPDYPVESTIEEVIAGKDPQLERVLKLIRN